MLALQMVRTIFFLSNGQVGEEQWTGNNVKNTRANGYGGIRWRSRTKGRKLLRPWKNCSVPSAGIDRRCPPSPRGIAAEETVPRGQGKSFFPSAPIRSIKGNFECGDGRIFLSRREVACNSWRNLWREILREKYAGSIILRISFDRGCRWCD